MQIRSRSDISSRHSTASTEPRAHASAEISSNFAPSRSMTISGLIGVILDMGGHLLLERYALRLDMAGDIVERIPDHLQCRPERHYMILLAVTVQCIDSPHGDLNSA